MLAEKLGKTVADLLEEIESDELSEWMAYYKILADERKKAEKQAANQAKSRRR